MKAPISANFHYRPYTSQNETGWFQGPYRSVWILHRLENYIFGLSLPVASLDIIIVLVQTRYHGDRHTPISANFHCRPYMAQHESGQFLGSYRSVRFLHQLRVYIYRLSFPIPSFWYAPCIGTESEVAPSLHEFPLSSLYVATCDGVYSLQPRTGRMLYAPTQGLHL